MILYEKIINLSDKQFIAISSFLNKKNLKITDVDCTIVAWKENEIIGVCSKIQNLIKNVAVDRNYKEQNVFAQLISKIMLEIYKEKYKNVFVITKKENRLFFESLNFKLIYENFEISFLTDNDYEYQEYKHYIAKLKLKTNVGIILLNANPLTLGHQRLINLSRKENDQTLLIPVVDDSSFFSTNERIEIIEANIKDWKNVVLLRGTEFLISKKLFPSYFISSEQKIIQQESKMNAWLFNDIFKSQLKKNKITRYLGSEPYSKTTNEYNLETQFTANYKTVIIDRFTNDANDIISASKVRKFIFENDFENIKKNVSIITFNYIKNKKFHEKALRYPELIFKNN